MVVQPFSARCFYVCERRALTSCTICRPSRMCRQRRMSSFFLRFAPFSSFVLFFSSFLFFFRPLPFFRLFFGGFFFSPLPCARLPPFLLAHPPLRQSFSNCREAPPQPKQCKAFIYLSGELRVSGCECTSLFQHGSSHTCSVPIYTLGLLCLSPLAMSVGFARIWIFSTLEKWNTQNNIPISYYFLQQELECTELQNFGYRFSTHIRGMLLSNVTFLDL